MNEFEPARVNRAIQRGLARCRQSTAPVVELAQFLDDLRADPTWSDSSIRLVESGIRHVLARIVRTQTNDRSRNGA